MASQVFGSTLADLKTLKPYMCALCREAFSKAPMLQRHMMKAHGLREEEGEGEKEDDEVEEEKRKEDKGEKEDLEEERQCLNRYPAISEQGEHFTCPATSNSFDDSNIADLPILASESTCSATVRQLVAAVGKFAGSVKSNVPQYHLSATDTGRMSIKNCVLEESMGSTQGGIQTLQKAQDIVAEAACAADIHMMDHFLSNTQEERPVGGKEDEEDKTAERKSEKESVARGQSSPERVSFEQRYQFVPVILERSTSLLAPEHESPCAAICTRSESGGSSKESPTSAKTFKCEKSLTSSTTVKCKKSPTSGGTRDNVKPRENSRKQHKEPWTDRPKSLGQKLKDVQKANKESERMRLLLQETAAVLKSSKGKRKSGQESDGPSPIQERTSTSTSKPKVTEIFMCYICTNKFPTIDECVDHMKDNHLMEKLSKGPHSAPFSGASMTLKGQDDKLLFASSRNVEVPHDIASSKVLEGREIAPSSPTSNIDIGDKMRGVIKNGNSSLGSSVDGKCENNQLALFAGPLMCSFCSEVCKNKRKLLIHQARKCGKDGHRCYRCIAYSAKPSGKELEEMARAVEETRDETDSSDYKQVRGKRLVVQFHQCILCNERFAVEKHLREHLKTHETIVCQFCDTAFPSTRELCRHVPMHNRGPLMCRTCQQTFFSTYMLLLHMRGHTGNYRCQVCDASFMFQVNLLRHMKRTHPKVDDQSPGIVKCNDFVEGGCSPKRLTKGWTRELNFKCHICGKLYRKEATLQQHHERIHSVNSGTGNSRRVVCEVCGVVRSSMKHLKSHMTCHKEPSKKCPDCGKLFVRACSLKSHVRQVHRRRREFQCQYCGKNLTSKASLIDHERLHTGERPYECGDCGKRFRLSTSYKTHQAMEHATERPFACDKCPKRFTVRRLLMKHARTHLPEGNWECSVCGKTFKRKDLLKNHTVLHQRQVRCRQCGRYFSNEFALRYHTKKIHKIDLYRTNPPETLPLSGILSPHQAQGSSQLNPHDFRIFSTSGHRDSLSESIVNSTSQDDIDGDSIDVTCPLPTPAALVSSELGFDPGRLSDPTNLAISAILSDLCKRV